MSSAELRHALGRHCIDGPDGLWVSPDSAASLAEILHVLVAHGAALLKDVKLTRTSLRALGAVDDAALTIDAGAGVTLHALEQHLAAKGACLGAMSPGALGLTVGEYIESGYAGLHAVEGGRLEPLYTRLEVVLPDGGLLVTSRAPRAASGPDLAAMVAGAGGKLGLVVGATLRLRPLPSVRQELASSFPSARALVATLQAVLADGCLPYAVRLVAGARPTSSVELRGDLALVSRGAATLAHRGFARGARPLAPPVVPALGGQEREVTWAQLEQALEAGKSLEIYRLSLGSCVARGELPGLPLEQPAPWTQGHALAPALDARGAVGVVP